MINDNSEFLISRYDDGDLTDKEGQELQELLAAQPQAKRIHRQYQQLDQHLGQLPSEIEQVDFNAFGNRVRSGIDQALQIQTRRKWLRRILIPLSVAAVLAIASLGPVNPFANKGQMSAQPQPRDIQMPRVISVGLVRQTSLASVQTVVRISLAQPQSGTDETNRDFPETKGEVICYAGPAQIGPGDTSPENSEYDLNIFFF